MSKTKPIGARQRIALLMLQETGRLNAEELGSALHWQRRLHDPGARCQWCANEGAEVLASLARRRLVIFETATVRVWEGQ